METLLLNRTGSALFASVLALAASLASSPALAAPAPPAPKDAQAEKAIVAALDTDYLETKFDAAEKKLRAAVTACGDKGCTPSVKARVYVALATVLAGGKKQLEDAREAFVEALKLDPAIKPDPDLLSSETTFAFENARKDLKLDAPATGPGAASGPSSGGLKHAPVKEQRVRTPVPLYVEVDRSLLEMVSRVSVSFLSPGAAVWESLLMKKVVEGGFGINVPCDDVANEGTLKYHITVTAESGAILAAVGSRTEPLTTVIKTSIEGEPPHFPGFAPPDTCRETEESKQCLDDRQCNEQFACVDGACVPRTARTPEPEAKGFQNWVTLTLQPDVSFFSGEGVCLLANQTADNFTCIREDGSRYTGTPTLDKANNVNPGFAFSTLRVALSYERVFLHNITAGLRLGFSIFGGSQQNVSFFPLHIEARGAYWLAKRPFESKGVRPFVMVSAGAAQLNSPVEVQVLEDGVACGADPGNINDPCTKSSNRESTIEKRLQFVDAYKQAGFGFATVGAGVAVATLDRVSFNVGLRAGLTFPILTMIISPEAGLSVGF
jgi:hypothetical protein